MIHLPKNCCLVCNISSEYLFLWNQSNIRSGVQILASICRVKQMRYVTPQDSVGLIVTSDVRKQFAALIEGRCAPQFGKT